MSDLSSIDLQYFAARDNFSLAAIIESYETLLSRGVSFGCESLVNLGKCYIDCDQTSLAVPLLKKANEKHPCDPSPLFHIAIAYCRLKDFVAARAACLSAIEINRSSPDLLCLLGQIEFDASGSKDTALALYEEALSIDQCCYPGLLNAGNIYSSMGEYDRAEKYFARALEASPDSLDARYNMGRLCHVQGRLREALQRYDDVLSMDPMHVKARWNRSLCALLLGDYQHGWTFHDSRHDLEDATGPHVVPPLPRWQGEPLGSKFLVLVSEQGFGDVIQFVRYAKVLAERGVTVRLCIQSQLHALVIASGLDPAPLGHDADFDGQDACWLPLLSLPRLLSVTPEAPLLSSPYLTPLRSHVRKWRNLLAAESDHVIGIHWQGSPYVEAKCLEFKGRSLPLDAFAPLAALAGVKLLSLQKGFGSEQMQTCSFADRFLACQAEVDATWDFLETAAIIENCDLVVTSDSAVAHLAAAIGKPTWLLLQKVPEWRWGMNSDQTFWYPSMRLFRQTTHGDWEAVIQRVALMVPAFLRGLSATSSAAKRSPSEYGDERAVWWYQLKMRAQRRSQPFWDWVAAGASVSEPSAAVTDSAPTISDVTITPDRLDDKLAIVYRLIDQQALDNAEILARQAVALSAAAYADAHCALGLVLLKQGAVEQALEALEQALRLAPESPEVTALLAIIWLQKGNQQRSRVFYEKALDYSGASLQNPEIETLCATEWAALQAAMAAIPLRA